MLFVEDTQMDARLGDWHQTYTGKKFWPLDPNAEEICIEDIAHSLSLLCRFGGHCKEFYSVAQHSVMGARAIYNSNYSSEYLALHFLLHDAAEAYICDLPRPVKKHSELGRLYKEVEHKLELVIASKFNLEYPMPALIKVTDSRMLLTEKRDLLADPPGAWKEDEGDFPLFHFKISSWTPQEAENEFMLMFNAWNTEYIKRFNEHTPRDGSTLY